MKLNKIIIPVIILILISGCGKTKETDAQKFKQEFEQYNKTKLKLEIDEDNVMTHVTSEKINSIIEKGTGLIFIGSPKDNLSRAALKILLKASENTDISKIYYIDNLKDIKGLDKIENIKSPIVISILEGKIVSNHIGTINDKEKLSSDEELELYNMYVDSIHQILDDACDERC